VVNGLSGYRAYFALLGKKLYVLPCVSVTGQFALSGLIAVKTQLDSISCGVLYEYLGDPEPGHLACLESDIVPLQARFHFRKIRAGKRHMVEGGGYMGMPYFIRPSLA